MKLIKMILTLSLPIILLYLLNIAIFNRFPVFLACFCGASIYIPSLDKTKSFKKLANNFLDKEKNNLSTQDFINLALIFILTFLFTGLIYTFGKYDELGRPFWGTSIIFLLMSYFKFPKRFFS